MNSCKDVESLLSGFLDGELTQQQSQQVHLHIEQCEACRTVYQDLQQMKQGIANMEKPTMSEQQLQNIMSDRPARGMAWMGWLLFVTGISVIVGFVAYQFFIDESMALWLKLTMSAIYGGIAFLFFSVLRQRLIARKTDRYKGVDL